MEKVPRLYARGRSSGSEHYETLPDEDDTPPVEAEHEQPVKRVDSASIAALSIIFIVVALIGLLRADKWWMSL